MDQWPTSTALSVTSLPATGRGTLLYCNESPKGAGIVRSHGCNHIYSSLKKTGFYFLHHDLQQYNVSFIAHMVMWLSMMPSANRTRCALCYKSSAHQIRLDETTQSETVHIEKGENGQQHHLRITIETQPSHRVTVNCDWILSVINYSDSIIAVGDTVVRLSWSNVGIKPFYHNGISPRWLCLHKWNRMVGKHAVKNKGRSCFSYDL